MSDSRLGGHDPDLYDPSRHDNQIVAVYENRSAAEQARDTLVQAGVPRASTEVLDRTETATDVAGTTADRPEDQGFWEGIKSLFAPEEDVHAYHHAIGQGHAMLLVTPGAGADRHQIIEALERTNPVDFDARLAEWRQSGYEYPGTAAGTSAAGLDDAGASSTGVAEMAAPGVGTTGMGAAAAGSSYETGAERAGPGGQDDRIQVVEERLRVGKREVARGAVRVRSYVVERPVEEQVRLHEETIRLDRHPVDRPLQAGEDAFKERTIEARATAEEAVISKEARVVEEIDLHKEAADRTETVRDTVRETKVEIEDDRAGKAAGTTGPANTGTMGTGGATSNATPGAATSGANAPRK